MVNLELLFLITIPKMVYAWHEPSDLWLCKSKQVFWWLSRLPVKLFPHNTTYFYQIHIWPIYQMVKIIKPSKQIWNNFQANHVFLCNAQKKNFDFFHISSPIFYCICNDLLLFFLQLELMVVHEKTECITVLESRALELQIVWPNDRNRRFTWFLGQQFSWGEGNLRREKW